GALAGGAIGNNSRSEACDAPVQGAYDPYYGQPVNQGYAYNNPPPPASYDRGYYDRDGRLLGGPDGDRGYDRYASDYRRQECRWDRVIVRDRAGYPHRQDVWECRGRDGYWRPAPRY